MQYALMPSRINGAWASGCLKRRDERFDERDGVVHQLRHRFRSAGVSPAARRLELRGTGTELDNTPITPETVASALEAAS